jgi:hypothetical protein
MAALYAGIAITGFVRTRRDPRESRRRAALPRALRTVRSRGAEAGVRSLVADLLDRPAAGVTGQDCLDLAPDSADARLLAAVLTQAESARFGAVGTSPAPDPQKLRAAMRRVAARVRAEETS